MIRDRIARNTAFKILGEVGNRGLAMVQFVLLARWLGVRGFGEFSFAFSLAALFMPLMDLGTNAIFSRELARTPEKLPDFAARANALKLVSGLAMIVLIGTAGTVLERTHGHDPRLILLMGILVAATGALEHLGAFFTGLERMGVEAALKTLNKTLCLAGAWAGFVWGRSLASTVVGILAGFAASLVWGQVRLARLGGSSGLRWDRPWIAEMLRHSLPLMGAWIFLYAYENQDLVLLGLLKMPSLAIGHFAAVMKLLDVLKAAPFLLAGAVFPVLAQLSRADPAGSRRLTSSLLKWMAAIALPVGVGLGFLGGPVLGLIFGRDYSSAAPVLAVALWALPGAFLNVAILQVLVAHDLQGKITRGAAMAAGLNALALVTLAGPFGLPGAAAALAISEAAFLIYNLVVLERHLPGPGADLLRYAARPVGATAVLAAFLWKTPFASWILSAAVGGLLYGAVLGLLKGIPSAIPFPRSKTA